MIIERDYRNKTNGFGWRRCTNRNNDIVIYTLTWWLDGQVYVSYTCYRRVVDEGGLPADLLRLKRAIFGMMREWRDSRPTASHGSHKK